MCWREWASEVNGHKHPRRCLVTCVGREKRGETAGEEGREGVVDDVLEVGLQGGGGDEVDRWNELRRRQSVVRLFLLNDGFRHRDRQSRRPL